MKRTVKLFLSIIITMNMFSVYGQDDEIENKFLYGIETGIDYQDFQVTDFDFIRGDISSYYGSSNQSLSSFFVKWNVGAKVEYRFKNDRLGLFAGLRYTGVESAIGEYSQDSYFLLLFRQYETNTEYLRIKEINQHSNYLGIPVELRLFPFNTKTIRPFIKVGMEFNYRLSTTNEVIFVDERMNEYKDEVLNKFKNPDDFYSSFYLSQGINFVIEDKFNISVELKFPVFYISSALSSFVDSRVFGVGTQINFQLPF